MVAWSEILWAVLMVAKKLALLEGLRVELKAALRIPIAKICSLAISDLLRRKKRPPRLGSFLKGLQKGLQLGIRINLATIFLVLEVVTANVLFMMPDDNKTISYSCSDRDMQMDMNTCLSR